MCATVLFAPLVVSAQQPSSKLVAALTYSEEDSKEDVVRVRQPSKPAESGWYAARVVEYAGRIKNFDDRLLEIELAGGELAKFSAGQVETVQLAWTEPAIVDALALIDRREYRQAVAALDAARKEMPVWKQRFVIEHIVRSAEAMNNVRTAGIVFANLAASQPPPLMYGSMPLCWTVRDVDRTLAESAAGWLKSEDEASQLLGASWLLLGHQGEEARSTLLRLRSSMNPMIAQLAVAQSWRVTSPPETVAQLPKWFEFRDQLPQALQLGPTEFLADRLQRIGEVDLAIGEWSRIATRHRERYDRAVQALTAAATNLERMQRPAEVQLIKEWLDQLEGS